MLILFLYTDVRILSLFDHVDCDNKLLTYLLTYLQSTDEEYTVLTLKMAIVYCLHFEPVLQFHDSFHDRFHYIS